MTNIRMLLNPESEEELSETSNSSPPTPNTATSSPTLPIRKRQKITKDAAIFKHGKIHGECRYPPHEYQDEMLAAEHQKFQLYPMGDIAYYPRRIPYNSEKKTFLSKTGRGCFEIFHYNFSLDGHEKPFCMMWDYNIGLVRITPLFRCNGYSKTTPAKMLNKNVGLREICHSITGGALIAQGYWMPYEAAKAVAATFCWDIRYALTPVFGVDFPSTCIEKDSERYGIMIIDPAITRRCAEQAQIYKILESRASSPASSIMPSPATPKTPIYARQMKQLRSNAVKLIPESGYSTEISIGKKHTLNLKPPELTYGNIWTRESTPYSIAHPDLRLPSPKEILAGSSSDFSGETQSDLTSDTSLSSPELSPKSKRLHPRDEECDEEDVEQKGNSDTPGIQDTDMSEQQPVSDEKAACLLINLRLQKTVSAEPMRMKKRNRRASA